MAQPKLVLVEWVDSAQPLPAWRHLDDVPTLEVIECVSVGWLVGRSRDVLMLAPNIGNIQSGGSAQGSGFVRIPRCSITRIVELVEVRKRRSA